MYIMTVLYKLTSCYAIDGRLLKFITYYLHGREQCVTVENSKFPLKNVLSGVPKEKFLGLSILSSVLMICLKEFIMILNYTDYQLNLFFNLS